MKQDEWNSLLGEAPLGDCVRVVVTLSLLYLSVCVTLTARGGQDPVERGRRKQGRLEGSERGRGRGRGREANTGEREKGRGERRGKDRRERDQRDRIQKR